MRAAKGHLSERLLPPNKKEITARANPLLRKLRKKQQEDLVPFGLL